MHYDFFLLQFRLLSFVVSNYCTYYSRVSAVFSLALGDLPSNHSLTNWSTRSFVVQQHCSIKTQSYQSWYIYGIWSPQKSYKQERLSTVLKREYIWQQQATTSKQFPTSSHFHFLFQCSDNDSNWLFDIWFKLCFWQAHSWTSNFKFAPLLVGLSKLLWRRIFQWLTQHIQKSKWYLFI